MNDNKLLHPIRVYLDSYIWDFLFENRLYLPRELPRDEFTVCISPEAEFETASISDEVGLKAFAQSTIAKCAAQSADNSTTLPDEVGLPPTARARHSVILALDTKGRLINNPHRQGCKVIYLSEFAEQPWKLKYFIKSELGMLRIPEHRSNGRSP